MLVHYTFYLSFTFLQEWPDEIGLNSTILTSYLVIKPTLRCSVPYKMKNHLGIASCILMLCRFCVWLWMFFAYYATIFILCLNAPCSDFLKPRCTRIGSVRKHKEMVQALLMSNFFIFFSSFYPFLICMFLLHNHYFSKNI